MTVSSHLPVSATDPPLPPSAPQAARDQEIAALRGALLTETRIAEALAQRGRGLIDLVETLARRALREAATPREAEARLEALSRAMRISMLAGECAAPCAVAPLAERVLAAFETGEGPRIAIDGPEVELGADAARLVALVLFELGSVASRRGALAQPDGRAWLTWELEPDGPLRILWREFGVRGAAERRNPRPGGGLLPILMQRFGAPLRVQQGALGLTAELTVPATELRRRPASRALLAVTQPGLAATVSALLYAGGMQEVRLSRGLAETAAAMRAERFDVVVVDAALAARGAGAGAPRLVVTQAGGPEAPADAVTVQLPASPAAFAEAIRRARDA